VLPKVEIKRKESSDNLKVSNFMPEIMSRYLKMKPKEKIGNGDYPLSQIYEKALGGEISSISSILKYENGTLTIKVKTAVWKNELKFREEEIKNALNSQKFSNLRVNKIIFV